MKNANAFWEIIHTYSPELVNYLLSNNFHGHGKGLSCNVIESIHDIIEKALENAPDLSEISALERNLAVKNSDLIYFGDVHGQLDLFLQNLYIAGIIEKDGSLKTKLTKSIVQLGDTVDKGSFQFETLVYLRMLKNETKKQGLNFEYLVGNHELKLIQSPKACPEDVFMGKMLREDLKKNMVKLSYKHPQQNILSFHSSMEKEILLDPLLLMCDEEAFKRNLFFAKKDFEEIKELLKTKHSSTNTESSSSDLEGKALAAKKLQENTSYKKIYSTLSKAGLSMDDVSKWLNDKFREVVLTDTLKEDSPYFSLFASPSGYLRSKAKASNTRHHERGSKSVREFLIQENEIKYINKPLQISGHKQTVYGVKGGYGNIGGIMQNKANVFADCGLVDYYGGYQAFVALNSKTNSLYAVEFIKDNKSVSGLDTNKSPILLGDKINLIKIRKLETLVSKDRCQNIRKESISPSFQ